MKTLETDWVFKPQGKHLGKTIAYVPNMEKEIENGTWKNHIDTKVKFTGKLNGVYRILEGEIFMSMIPPHNSVGFSIEEIK